MVPAPKIATFITLFLLKNSRIMPDAPAEMTGRSGPALWFTSITCFFPKGKRKIASPPPSAGDVLDFFSRQVYDKESFTDAGGRCTDGCFTGDPRL
jgi:hypothetical protein